MPSSFEYFPLEQETEIIIGLGIEIHKELGYGFLEVVYKDALFHEFTDNDIMFEREKPYPVYYKQNLLQHKFHADFVVFDQIILEVKSKEGISDSDMAQTINYLKCSGCKVGLILNFGKMKLGIKRVVL